MYQEPPVLLGDERLDEVNDRIRLIQKPKGLTFGTDALLLAGFVEELRDGTGLELGGGSGIISLLLLGRDKLGTVDVLEVQPAYADLIRRNALCNGLSHRIRVLEGDVRNTELLPPTESYDCVFTNPPYLPKDSGPENRHSPKSIARREVLGDIGDFLKAAGRSLKWGGAFYCVYRAERIADLFSAMREGGIEPKCLLPVQAEPTAAPVLILVKGKKGGRPGLIYKSPLFLYRPSTREPSEEIKYLHQNGSFPREQPHP